MASGWGAILDPANMWGMQELDEGGIKELETMTPEQKKIFESLGAYLQGKVGEGLPGWEGAFTAPLSNMENVGMSQLGDYVSGGIGSTGQSGVNAFNSMMNVDPNQIAAEYMKYQAPAEQRYLNEVLIPNMKESMVPGGTLRSTGTERGIGDIISKFGEGQLGRIGQTIEGARSRAAGLIPQTGSMAGIEGGVPQMEAAFNYGQLPRMIEQAELTSQIEEFRRTTPELSPILDKLMSYVGLSTKTMYNQPAEQTLLQSLLGSAGGLVGSVVGSVVG